MTYALDAKLLTPDEVANYLRLSRDTVYRYIREGKLGAARLGRSYRVSQPDLDRFMSAHKTEPGMREALWRRVLEIRAGNADIPEEEVERDVAEAVAWARRTVSDASRP